MSAGSSFFEKGVFSPNLSKLGRACAELFTWWMDFSSIFIFSHKPDSCKYYIPVMLMNTSFWKSALYSISIFSFYQAYVPFICGLLGRVLIWPIIMNLLKCLIFILFEKVKPGILQKPWYFSLRIQDRDKKKEKIMILFSLQSRLNYNFHCAIRKHMFASLVAHNWIKSFQKEFS